MIVKDNLLRRYGDPMVLPTRTDRVQIDTGLTERTADSRVRPTDIVVDEKTRKSTLPNEEVDASDPRHPDHLEWLADQAILQKKQKMRAAAPWVIAGGGGLVAVLAVVLVVRKRRKAA